MTQPIRRPSSELQLQDHHVRIRALEASVAAAGAAALDYCVGVFHYEWPTGTDTILHVDWRDSTLGTTAYFNTTDTNLFALSTLSGRLEFPTIQTEQVDIPALYAGGAQYRITNVSGAGTASCENYFVPQVINPTGESFLSFGTRFTIERPPNTDDIEGLGFLNNTIWGSILRVRFFDLAYQFHFRRTNPGTHSVELDALLYIARLHPTIGYFEDIE